MDNSQKELSNNLKKAVEPLVQRTEKFIKVVSENISKNNKSVSNIQKPFIKTFNLIDKNLGSNITKLDNIVPVKDKESNIVTKAIKPILSKLPTAKDFDPTKMGDVFFSALDASGIMGGMMRQSPALMLATSFIAKKGHSLMEGLREKRVPKEDGIKKIPIKDNKEKEKQISQPSFIKEKEVENIKETSFNDTDLNILSSILNNIYNTLRDILNSVHRSFSFSKDTVQADEHNLLAQREATREQSNALQLALGGIAGAGTSTIIEGDNIKKMGGMFSSGIMGIKNTFMTGASKLVKAIASPTGALVAGVAAVGLATFGAVKALKRTGEITGKQEENITALDKTLVGTAGALSGLTLGLVKTETMYKGIQWVGDWFKKFPVFLEKLPQMFSIVIKKSVDWILGFFQKFQEFIPELRNMIVNIATWFVKVFKNIIKLSLKLLWELIKNLPKMLLGVLKLSFVIFKNVVILLGQLLWESVKMILKGLLNIPKLLWNGIKALPDLLWKGLKLYFEILKGFFFTLPMMIMKLFLKLPMLLWKGLTKFGSWIWKKFISLPTLIWEKLQGIFTGIVDAIKTVIATIPGVKTEDEKEMNKLREELDDTRGENQKEVIIKIIDKARDIGTKKGLRQITKKEDEEERQLTDKERAEIIDKEVVKAQLEWLEEIRGVQNLMLRPLRWLGVGGKEIEQKGIADLNKKIQTLERGKSIPQSSSTTQEIKVIGQKEKGGVIYKTGLYKLHKGEEVIPSDTVNNLTPSIFSDKLTKNFIPAMASFLMVTSSGILQPQNNFNTFNNNINSPENSKLSTIINKHIIDPFEKLFKIESRDTSSKKITTFNINNINKSSSISDKNDTFTDMANKFNPLRIFPSLKRKEPNKNDIYNYLINNKGTTPLQAQGIIANIEAESSFRTGAMGDSGTSGGLFQHHNTRFEGMKNYVGGDNWKQDWRGQIDYAFTEREMKKYLLREIKTISEATSYFVRDFEKPKNTNFEIKKRIKIAKLNQEKLTLNPQKQSFQQQYTMRSNIPTVISPLEKQYMMLQQREAQRDTLKLQQATEESQVTSGGNNLVSANNNNTNNVSTNTINVSDSTGLNDTLMNIHKFIN